MQEQVNKTAVFEKRGSNLIIHLLTDLDHHSETGIREEADREIWEGRIQNIVFDFNKVDFMDSSGIGVVMGRYKKIKYMGGRLAVAGINANVNRIMRMAGMLNLLECYTDTEEALAVFSGK